MTVAIGRFRDAMLRYRWVRTFQRATLAYAFILPAFALVFAVTLYAIYYAFETSLYAVDLVERTRFVGLRNYRRMLADPNIHSDFKTTLIYLAGAVPLTVGTGLVLAVMLNRRFPLRPLIRALLIIPWIASYLVSALLWKWLMNPDFGALPWLLVSMGLPKVSFLGRELAIYSLIVTTVWNAYPIAMIILLAALQQVPDSLLQAAQVDGASVWMRFRRIVYPLIKPSIMVTVIVMSLHFLNIVTLPLVLTGGGPGRSTEIISLRLYKEAFVFFNMGFASAMAVGVFFLNLILTIFYVRALSLRRRIY